MTASALVDSFSRMGNGLTLDLEISSKLPVKNRTTLRISSPDRGRACADPRMLVPPRTRARMGGRGFDILPGRGLSRLEGRLPPSCDFNFQVGTVDTPGFWSGPLGVLGSPKGGDRASLGRYLG